MRRHRGFTIIELLAVLGIIAVLLALLIPTIVETRERARQVQCTNNLKQIALSLRSYLTCYEMLPAGATIPQGRSDGGGPPGDPMSWMAQILPYLEQSYIANSLNETFGAHDPVNRTVAITRINTFICPSTRQDGAYAIPEGFGGSTYAGCHHDVEAPIGKNDRGVFFLDSGVTESQVSDGMSQTFFIGEIPLPGEPGWISGTRATLRNTGHPLGGVNLGPGLLHLKDGKIPVTDEVSLEELERMMRAGEIDHHTSFVGGFGSRYHTGAFFSLGDGSARFIHSTIDPDVYRRLGNRDDGEIIDDETAY